MSPQPGYQVPGRAPVESFPDSGYWNQQFRSEPYFLEGDSYDDYEPAYRLGYQARHQHPSVQRPQAHHPSEQGKLEQQQVSVGALQQRRQRPGGEITVMRDAGHNERSNENRSKRRESTQEVMR